MVTCNTLITALLRYNSYTIKLQVQNLFIFNIFPELCNHHCNLIAEYFNQPKRHPTSVNSHSSFPAPSHPANSLIAFLLWDLPIQDVAYKWKKIIFGHQCLASFTWPKVFKVHTCWDMEQHFSPLYCWIHPTVYHILLIHSIVDKHLAPNHFLSFSDQFTPRTIFRLDIYSPFAGSTSRLQMNSFFHNPIYV